jgi:hypothetical protein
VDWMLSHPTLQQELLRTELPGIMVVRTGLVGPVGACSSRSSSAMALRIRSAIVGCNWLPGVSLASSVHRIDSLRCLYRRVLIVRFPLKNRRGTP